MVFVFRYLIERCGKNGVLQFVFRKDGGQTLYQVLVLVLVFSVLMRWNAEGHTRHRQLKPYDASHDAADNGKSE